MDPKRLLDSGADAFERELLHSARIDSGTERAFGQAMGVWTALGVQLAAGTAVAAVGAVGSASVGAGSAGVGSGAVVAATASSATASGAGLAAGVVAAGAAAAGSIAPMGVTGLAVGAGATAVGSSMGGAVSAGAVSSLALVGKWVGIGLLAGAVTTGGALTLDRQAAHTRAEPQVGAGTHSVAAAAKVAARAELPGRVRERTQGSLASEPVELEPSATLAQAEGAQRAAAAQASNPSVAGAAQAAALALQPVVAPAPNAAARPSVGVLPPIDEAFSPGLSAELQPLERARQALRRDDRQTAAQALSEYQRRFPRGALWQEAVLLEVEARLEQSDVEGATRAARRVIDLDPSGPYALRARALFAERGRVSP